MHASTLRTLLLAAPLAIALPVDAADWDLRVYSGDAWHHDYDLRLKQPGGTDLTFEDASWDADSFRSPVYYGVRVERWFDTLPNWGASLEFFHAKAYVREDDVVNVTGTRAGVPVNGPERISDTITSFNMSHGLNFAMANAQYRWFPTGSRNTDSLLGRTYGYAGAGVGAAIPHVEAVIGGVETGEYQLAGPAVQGLLGVNVDIWKWVTGFVEYKFTYADVNADLTGGGTIEVEPLTHHVVFGLGLSF